MKIFQYAAFYCFFFLGVFTQCEKEVVKTQTLLRNPKWLPESRIDRYSKYILDVKAFDDRINFSYPSGMLSLDSAGDVSYLPQVNEYERRGFISENYYILYWENWNGIDILNFTNAKRSVFPNSNNHLANFTQFGALGLTQQWIAVNQSETKFAAVYLDSMIHDYLVIGEMPYVQGPYFIDSVQSFDLKIPSGGLCSVYSFYDHFYVCGNSLFRRFDVDGTFQDMLPMPFGSYAGRMFSFRNELYVFVNETIYVSSDQGDTWQARYIVDGLQAFQYHPFEEVLLASYKDKIYHLDFSDDNFSALELENEGLENNFITNVAIFNDTVFVATQAGTYKRALTNIFEYKEN